VFAILSSNPSCQRYLTQQEKQGRGRKTHIIIALNHRAKTNPVAEAIPRLVLVNDVPIIINLDICVPGPAHLGGRLAILSHHSTTTTTTPGARPSRLLSRRGLPFAHGAVTAADSAANDTGGRPLGPSAAGPGRSLGLLWRRRVPRGASAPGAVCRQRRVWLLAGRLGPSRGRAADGGGDGVRDASRG